GPGTRAAALVALLDDEPEESSLSVFPALQVRGVLGDGDELPRHELHDLRIGIDERTARHAVVSDTAERVAVHRPHEERLSFRERAAPPFPQVRLPRNLRPAHLLRARPDRRMPP